MALPFDVDSTWVNPSSVTLDGGELRRADGTAFAGDGSALGARGGIVRHGDTSLTVTVSGSDVLTIQPGSVVIPGNAVAGSGCYRTALASAVTGNLAARDATYGRIDLVAFRQLDTDVVGTHGAYTARVEVIAGTPSASPAVPALPSMAVELARVTVPAAGGAAATVDSSYRTYAAAIGGDLAVQSAARLPAAAAKWQRAIALDTGIRHTWDGTAWTAASATGALTASVSMTDFTHVLARRGDVGLISLLGVTPAGAIAVGGQLATIPVGFRPSAQWRAPVVIGGGTVSFVTLNTNGTITVAGGVTAGNSINGEAVYPL